MIRYLLFSNVILILALVSCESLESESDNSSYPTTIFALDSIDYENLVNEYRTFNNNQVCTSLNKYGFCEYNTPFCSISSVSITSESQTLSLAKQFIAQNRKFTGVKDVNKLVVELSYRLSQKEWKFTFDNQIYKGYEVFNTSIDVFLDYDGVTLIGGNWYPEISLPSWYTYDFQEARALLIGDTITYYCYTEEKIVVSDTILKNQGRKVIIPLEKENRIELRFTWEIFVIDQYDSTPYVFYVDVVTGEIVRQHQLFIC